MNVFRLLFILLHIFADKYFWYLIVYVSNTTWRSKLKPTHTHSSLSSQLVQTWPTVQCQYDKSVYGWKSVNLLSCDQLITDVGLRALTRMLHDDDGAPLMSDTLGVDKHGSSRAFSKSLSVSAADAAARQTRKSRSLHLPVPPKEDSKKDLQFSICSNLLFALFSEAL